jgi:hypothetical protein
MRALRAMRLAAATAALATGLTGCIESAKLRCRSASEPTPRCRRPPARHCLPCTSPDQGPAGGVKRSWRPGLPCRPLRPGSPIRAG